MRFFEEFKGFFNQREGNWERSKGSLIHLAIIIMGIVMILALAVSNILSLLREQYWSALRNEEIEMRLENSMKKAIESIQALPFEKYEPSEGIYEELSGLQFPKDWKMIDEQCGYVATIISFSGDEYVMEIWTRCNIKGLEKIEKAKIKFTTKIL